MKIMIKKIILKNVATYPNDEDTIIEPTKINFFYGNNGAGKTTITRILGEPEKYKDSLIEWDENDTQSKLIYNQNFVVFKVGPYNISYVKRIFYKKSYTARILCV